MDRLAVLRSFPLFKEASEERLQRLAAVSLWKTYTEGAPIWAAGDAATHLLLVRHGLVQVVRRLVSGEEATLALFGPREHVGLVVIMDGSRYPADAVAVSNVLDAILIPAAIFLESVEDDPRLLRAAGVGVVRRAASLRAKIEILTAGEIDRRLATLLLHLAERFGDEDTDGVSVVPLALTRRMLARLVGAREETVSRILSRWQRDNVASTFEGAFHLTQPALLMSIAAGG